MYGEWARGGEGRRVSGKAGWEGRRGNVGLDTRKVEFDKAKWK